MVKRYRSYLSIILFLAIMLLSGCGKDGDDVSAISGITTTVIKETTIDNTTTTIIDSTIPTGPKETTDTSNNTSNIELQTTDNIQQITTIETSTVPSITTTKNSEYITTTALQITTAANKSHRNITVLIPEASGRLVQSMNGYNIDYSNTNKGYIMVQNTTGITTYIWLIKDGVTVQFKMQGSGYEAYPLSKGNGAYTIRVLQIGANGQGFDMNTLNFNVNMDNTNNPFLYANLYVNYNRSSVAVNKSYELCFEGDSAATIVNNIYNFVASNIAYDYTKAGQITSGSLNNYIPSPDNTLAAGKGICSDYASLMATMLRTQGIPCKMVYGYINGGETYHAWNQIYYDGAWHLYDACIKSTGGTASSYAADKEY